MKNVKISDITLRECARNRSLSFKERVEAARTLDRLRPDVIELPAIRDEKADVLSNKTIASVVTAGPGCTSWCRYLRYRWSTSATRRPLPCWSW